MNILIEISVTKEIESEDIDKPVEHIRQEQRSKIVSLLNPLLEEGYRIVVNTRINK